MLSIASHCQLLFLGFANGDAADNLTANKSVKFDLSLLDSPSLAPTTNKEEEFTPLQNMNTSFGDDIVDVNKDGISLITELESPKKVLPAALKEIVPTTDKNLPPTSITLPSASKNIVPLTGKETRSATKVLDVSALIKGKDVVSKLTNESFANDTSFLLKDEYVQQDLDSQTSDLMFVPSFTHNQSMMSDSLFLQSLSETSNALKADIQKMLSRGGVPRPLAKSQSEVLDVTCTSDLEESVSIESTIRKKLAFSTKKKRLSEVDVDLTNLNLTNSSQTNDLPSYSFSSSVTSTIGSGSLRIRKTVDEKIEICRQKSDYKNDMLTTDSTLTTSVSNNDGASGVMPQFNLTSLSSVGEKTSNLNSEEGTIPSQPSSFSDPSFHNIADKHKSVSKLLGSTYKKTEHFLRKLEKLEVPGIDKEEYEQRIRRLKEAKIEAGLINRSKIEHLTPVVAKHNVEDLDGDVLELSDNEILFEQDIKTASLIDPYLSDSILQSCNKEDNSQTYQTNKSKADLGGEEGANATADEENTMTDLNVDKTLLEESKTAKDKSVTETTITEATNVSIDQEEQVIPPSTMSDTSSSQAETPPQVKRVTKSHERRSSTRNQASDTASSNDSERINRKIRRFAKLQKQRSLTNQRMKKKDVHQQHTPIALTQNENMLNQRNAEDSRRIFSAPSEFSVLKPMNNNFFENNSSSDEYMNLRSKKEQMRKEDQPINSRSHSSQKSNETASNNIDRKSTLSDYSRNELLESSLNTLLNEYEKPISGKFSESPLIKKLELLSKILREAKLKRYNSYLSDASQSSHSSVVRHNETPVNTKRLETPVVLQKEVPSPKESTERVLKNVVPSQDDISAKISSCSSRKSKHTVVTTACPHCSKRNASTNCPTPCMSSSDEAIITPKSQPLTLQTWTQTNNIPETLEQPKVTDDFAMSRKQIAPRKRWSDKEDSEEVDVKTGTTNVEAAGPANGGKRERRNTFVLEEPLQDLTLDSTTYEDKGKGSTAWFLSFNSENSETGSRPISTVPDLNTAYLDGKKESLDVLRYAK